MPLRMCSPGTRIECSIGSGAGAEPLLDTLPVPGYSTARRASPRTNAALGAWSPAGVGAGGDMGSIGETLRQARIDKGVTLAEAERSTFVRRRYLEALESDDFGSLPAQVYTRGFIRTYAEYLGLNPETILDLYQPPRGRESVPRLRAAA